MNIERTDHEMMAALRRTDSQKIEARIRAVFDRVMTWKRMTKFFFATYMNSNGGDGGLPPRKMHSTSKFKRLL